MKYILSLLFLIPTLLFSQQDFTVDVVNHSKVEKIEDRKVEFGVKENVEEFLINKGWMLNEKNSPELDIDSNGIVTPVSVHIEKIESPHRILNIIGTKWLKKSYIVEVHIVVGTKHYVGVGKRNTFLFAAFLNVENDEVPLNRKAFSKALQSSLETAIEQI